MEFPLFSIIVICLRIVWWRSLRKRAHDDGMGLAAFSTKGSTSSVQKVAKTLSPVTRTLPRGRAWKVRMPCAWQRLQRLQEPKMKKLSFWTKWRILFTSSYADGYSGKILRCPQDDNVKADCHALDVARGADNERRWKNCHSERNEVSWFTSSDHAEQFGNILRCPQDDNIKATCCVLGGARVLNFIHHYVVPLPLWAEAHSTPPVMNTNVVITNWCKLSSLDPIRFVLNLTFLIKP